MALTTASYPDALLLHPWSILSYQLRFGVGLQNGMWFLLEYVDVLCRFDFYMFHSQADQASLTAPNLNLAGVCGYRNDTLNCAVSMKDSVLSQLPRKAISSAKSGPLRLLISRKSLSRPFLTESSKEKMMTSFRIPQAETELQKANLLCCQSRCWSSP